MKDSKYLGWRKDGFSLYDAYWEKKIAYNKGNRQQVHEAERLEKRSSHKRQRKDGNYEHSDRRTLAANILHLIERLIRPHQALYPIIMHKSSMTQDRKNQLLQGVRAN